MIACQACGEENPAHARFCVACGNPLAPGAGAAEERKLVTVVFAELVGYRKATGASDPEDLRRVLDVYRARVGRVVANHGGTIDKYMGATALCVFGAPVAHEDDPERGVRAALRIREAVAEIDEAEAELALSVRIGVNTGEAVVARPGVGPQIGEAVTGDVVNTASRLQTAAAPGDVLVAAPTHEATGVEFEWREHEPVLAKGKAEPLEAWLALATRGRVGSDVRPRSPSPLIGRRDQVTQLQAAFRRAAGESTVQLVTITGEAGIGKSRLVEELSDLAEEWPSLVRWRQGRSLPYGEGLSFWALAEVVKADAGILDSDDPEQVDEKLRDVLEPHVPDGREREWLRSRLASLAGLESVDASREELFHAWRRWFEVLAADSPFVVVFEDLQWADDVLLDFIEHLADWAAGVPLLVVCVARPELYERRPGWGGARRNAAAVPVPPLSRQETAMLIGALLEGVVLPAPTQLELLERCGGNPLYAEEYVRMLRDHGIIEGETVGETSGVPMPASVHQLIGARIDTLPPTEKGVLQDAAIVGKVFWSGAVEAVSGLPEDVVIRALEESVRRRFVREVPDGAFRGQKEYAFDHLLVQEVCYGQIPRAARADRHVAVARWIRAVAGDRVFELAELLAHHYGEALAFTKATDPDRNVAGLEAATGAALMMAADRAKRIDASRAVELYGRARAVLREDDPERRRALIETAEAAEEAGRLDEANAAFDAAIAECRRAGDRLGLGEALARRARSSQEHSAGARSLLEEAIALLEAEEPGAELARAYTRMAGHLYVSGSNDAAIEWAGRSLALADELGVEAEAVLALQYRGAARSQAGDVTGLEDLRRALARGLELGLGDEVATAYNNLAYEVWFWQGPAAAAAIWEEMAAFCHVRGFATGETWAESGKLETLFDLGRWDEAFELATSLREWGRARGFRRVDMIAAVYRAWVWLRRGEADAAGREVDALLPEARQIGYGEFLAPALVIASEVALAQGDVAHARTLVAEFVRSAKANPEYWRVFLPVAVRVVVALGDVEGAGQLMTMTGERFPLRMRLSTESAFAILEEARGEVAAAAERFRRSAEGWEAYGFVLEEARTRTGLGRCLLALGRRDEGRRELDRARELLEPMGARPMLEEVDRVLAGAGASTG